MEGTDADLSVCNKGDIRDILLRRSDGSIHDKSDELWHCPDTDSGSLYPVFH